jgi:serine/threonine protein kinase
MLGETWLAADRGERAPAEVRRADGALAPGSEIKGYTIERLLGRGGMGVVYEATQTSLNRRVAIKLLPAESAQNRVLQARFRREALLQAALDHPHIVDVYETGACDAGLFIAMRLIRGETLRTKIGERGMDPEFVLELLTPVADALDTAHECGLVHRDVKPQNILVGNRAHAYLADFGLVRPFADRALTQAGGVLGTPAYLAPEVVRGSEATAASDIYSFAAVLHECLTGHASSCRSALDGEIADVVARGMAPEPEARPATSTDLMQLAHRALRPSRPRPVVPPLGTPVEPPAPDAPATPHGGWTSGLARRVLAGSCLALVAASVAALVVAMQRDAATADARVVVDLERPKVLPMSAAAFLAEHGLIPGTLPMSSSRGGVAIEANATVHGGGPEPLVILCLVRDLTAPQPVARTAALGPPPPNVAASFTVICWVPVDMLPGHRYQAVVWIFHPRHRSTPIATRSTTFDVPSAL